MSLENEIASLSRRAKKAAETVYAAPSLVKNRVLHKAAALLIAERKMIATANARDIVAARKAGLSGTMVDRLTLTDTRINTMVKGLREVAAQEDPVGMQYEARTRPNGLHIAKVRVPIGVVLIIYESRPNVTIDSAALCLKAGNAVILRGGKEAFWSNNALVTIFRKALRSAGVATDTVQLVQTTDRAAIPLLVRQTECIDLAIPRGGEHLIRTVMENARIPVLKHYKGVCNVYIDRYADPAMAQRIAVNAKVQRPGVCNAAETLLLDAKLDKKTSARILKALMEKGVTLKGCARSRSLVPGMAVAREADYYTEFLDLIMNVKVVDSVQGAIDHITKYSSHHTDAIVTRNKKRAQEFLARVDSSSVMWNASTRFSDGGEYGLGAEIGISTDKIHARGPMGAYDLTTYKWVVVGKGHVRK
ncbi:MAG: glutamate-5-semialdehyde dehydrogenase [Candidatus Raymondbacteria bacterium RifOxyC12_full_50_8]|uniref:Gamma-glutamyl phosphate reductase n=1 Tax=Candidatus Raymondbacteria bacterium RIFOXYD12_FULL_49_13 TaxID=1817890 RepID=A0A1F7FCM1_UNCRA|nr:MAG: glutamate-5-semialdehyde dehydrogenase [Candidatus Raymondbacteria bacterium RIFOXYA2_FULL_49_16]OGJ96598.1 MAG: glutamate-5-semialdehyde dehydrogenase [Candidatus Raymondbacteria bacterium RifOxyC12_full_50_8]OGJ99625.1 MAG: glutamate-5-semialdehyde dehydrogenase [Candidatus Raymondbacteria bacterium RifOxyB12_full_50_8]OGK04217.1 MAG: glutamate-5-semialdehyde dehydrogenase [Candidatus Raymondbacteria bacterium RIFOXYD12_FULL_49_13]OGP42501.1 MAG: glutamate-5-semialdehyde dehydrogenase